MEEIAKMAEQLGYEQEAIEEIRKTHDLQEASLIMERQRHASIKKDMERLTISNRRRKNYLNI